MSFAVCKPPIVSELLAGGVPDALCTGSKTSTLAEPPTCQGKTAPAFLPGLLSPLLLPLSLFASVMPREQHWVASRVVVEHGQNRTSVQHGTESVSFPNPSIYSITEIQESQSCAFDTGHCLKQHNHGLRLNQGTTISRPTLATTAPARFCHILLGFRYSLYLA